MYNFCSQHLPNLKRLDLSRSKKLTKVPDLALSPNIEKIILSGCESLTEVSSSSFLSELNCLCLNGCVQLKSLHLPRNVLSRSPGLVVLYDCAKLELSSISSKTHVFFHGGCTHLVRVENLYFLF
jgi:Leucine-rich repeat (LRR) protein